MDPITLAAIFKLGGSLIDKFFPNPEEKAKAQLELFKMQQNGELAQLAAETDLAKAQMAVNAVEAASPRLLTSGGRPFVIWVCGFSLCYVSLLEPMGRFIAKVCFDYNGQFPAIDTTITMQILMGLLGLSGMRSWEKGKNAEGNR